MARHLMAGTAPDLRMFTELFRIIAKYRIAIPPELAGTPVWTEMILTDQKTVDVIHRGVAPPRLPGPNPR